MPPSGANIKSASAGKSEIEQAISQLCGHCQNIYNDTSGRYAGQLPCYDCTEMLVTVNRMAAGRYIRKGGVFEVVVVDLIVGVGKGIVMGFAHLIDVGLAGRGFQEAVVALFKIIISPITTVIEASTTLRLMKQADAIVTGDSQTLKELQDYFVYTQLRMKQKSNSGTLNENAYEIAVINMGEQSAKAELRRKVDQIFANSATIMNFDNAKKSK